MIGVDEALARTLALAGPVRTEEVPLAEAFGRVLAAAAVARLTQPPFDSASMDGYAVRAADLPGPRWAAGPERVKLSAAWLIENAGIRRGFRLPQSRAGLSTKHALALSNRGGATAAELSELARFIQSRVHSEFGLLLQPEPVLVGVEL